jgi:hypothetical protein
MLQECVYGYCCGVLTRIDCEFVEYLVYSSIAFERGDREGFRGAGSLNFWMII